MDEQPEQPKYRHGIGSATHPVATPAHPKSLDEVLDAVPVLPEGFLRDLRQAMAEARAER